MKNLPTKERIQLYNQLATTWNMLTRIQDSMTGRVRNPEIATPPAIAENIDRLNDLRQPIFVEATSLFIGLRTGGFASPNQSQRVGYAKDHYDKGADFLLPILSEDV